MKKYTIKTAIGASINKRFCQLQNWIAIMKVFFFFFWNGVALFIRTTVLVFSTNIGMSNENERLLENDKFVCLNVCQIF